MIFRVYRVVLHSWTIFSHYIYFFTAFALVLELLQGHCTCAWRQWRRSTHSILFLSMCWLGVCYNCQLVGNTNWRAGGRETQICRSHGEVARITSAWGWGKQQRKKTKCKVLRFFSRVLNRVVQFACFKNAKPAPQKVLCSLPICHVGRSAVRERCSCVRAHVCVCLSGWRG